MQRTISDLERAFLKIKRDYEEEILRLKRQLAGEPAPSSHEAEEALQRPILPQNATGVTALAGLFANEPLNAAAPAPVAGVKRRGSTSAAVEDLRSQRLKSDADLPQQPHPQPAAQTAMPPSSYDWLVSYNLKIPRALSLNLLHSINFDGGVVCCVRFSVDGRVLAASGNKLCSFYSVETGHLLSSLHHNSDGGGDLYIRALSFSPNGHWFATGSEDYKIRLFSFSSLDGTAKLVQTLSGHTQDVYALEFLDNDTLVSGSGDHSIRFWSTKDSTCQKIIQVNADGDASRDCGVTSLAISSDRTLVAAGSLDRTVRVWDIASRRIVALLEGHEDSVYSVCFDNMAGSGSTLVSASLDKNLRVWDVASGKCTQVIAGHRDYVLSVVMFANASGRWIVSGSKDRSLQFYNPALNQPQFTLQGHKNSVISVAMSSQSGVFATGSGDCRARIWMVSASSPSSSHASSMSNS